MPYYHRRGGGARQTGFSWSPPASTRRRVAAQFQVPLAMGNRAPMVLPPKAAAAPASSGDRAPTPAAPQVFLSPERPAVPVTIRAPPRELARGALTPPSEPPARESSSTPESSAPALAKLFVPETALGAPASDAEDGVDVEPLALPHPARPGLGTVDGLKLMIGANHFVADVAGNHHLSHYDFHSARQGDIPQETTQALRGIALRESPSWNMSKSNTSRGPCQRPQETDWSIHDLFDHNKYEEGRFAQDSDINVRSDCVKMKSYESGRDKAFAPIVGQLLLNKVVPRNKFRKVPCIAEVPRIIISADRSHPLPLKDSTSSMAVMKSYESGRDKASAPIVGQLLLQKVNKFRKPPRKPPCIAEVPRIILSADHSHPPPLKDSTSSVAVVNVWFCNLKIAQPVNTDTKVLDLVKSALMKHNIRTSDFYLTLNGRLLDGDMLTDCIPDLNESNIHVHPRLRGGVSENIEISYQSLDDFINNNQHRLFFELYMPPDLRQRYMAPLSISHWSDLVQLSSPIYWFAFAVRATCGIDVGMGVLIYLLCWLVRMDK